MPKAVKTCGLSAFYTFVVLEDNDGTQAIFVKSASARAHAFAWPIAPYGFLPRNNGCGAGQGEVDAG